MKSIKFRQGSDLAPMPFDERICRMALDLKNLGLTWKPHVGCFVWDQVNVIRVDSPFPGNIYFILSMARFIDIFGNAANMIEKLVWLPTWHQARILCRQLRIRDAEIADDWKLQNGLPAGEDLYRLYQHIAEALQR